jgi:hypothetical protein
MRATNTTQSSLSVAVVDPARAKALTPRVGDVSWSRTLVVALEHLATVARFIDDPDEVEACRRRRRAYLTLARLTKHRLARSRYFSEAKRWRAYEIATARYDRGMLALRSGT